MLYEEDICFDIKHAIPHLLGGPGHFGREKACFIVNILLLVEGRRPVKGSKTGLKYTISINSIVSRHRAPYRFTYFLTKKSFSCEIEDFVCVDRTYILHTGFI